MPAGQYRERVMWQTAQGALDSFGTPLKDSFADQQELYVRFDRAYRPDEIQSYGSDMRQATMTFWVYTRPVAGISVTDRLVHRDNGRIFEIIGLDSMVDHEKELRMLVKEIQQ